VFATRGARGGFQLLGAYERSLPMPAAAPARRATSARQARARLSLPGRRLVALTGRPAGVHLRTRASDAGSGSWVEATWPIDTLDAAVFDVLSLGAEVEIVAPADLRAAVAAAARRIAERHSPEPVSR
jgi:predicted DNA-binding transcriptional regulator YafY